MAMTSAEKQRQYRERHGRKPDPNRKESDKRYREKHKEEIAVRKREWAKAHPEAQERRNAVRRAKRQSDADQIVHEMIDHYFYEWVTIGADRLFSGDEIWANKDAIRGWLYNEENWSEEDRANFAKVRKKDMPRIVDGISERVIEQIAHNISQLEIEW